MAGDWIPACKSLSRKREVLAIAATTGRNRYEVVGLLLDFWSWADEETLDGRLPDMPALDVVEEFLQAERREVIRLDFCRPQVD